MATAYHADSSDLTEKEILTWERFGTCCRELARQIADSGFEPEVLIAVARGGMLPGGGLSYALGVKLTDARPKTERSSAQVRPLSRPKGWPLSRPKGWALSRPKAALSVDG